jgi:hypothetical protein
MGGFTPLNGVRTPLRREPAGRMISRARNRVVSRGATQAHGKQLKDNGKGQPNIMKSKITTALGCILLLLGTAAQSRAQNLVQSISVNLMLYDTASSRNIVIDTQKFIYYLLGTNIPGAKLFLVSPGSGNAPGTTGALNAFLRITAGGAVLLEIPNPSQFNLYQDVVAARTSGTTIHTRAINRFSFDTGGVRAELQGISAWTIRLDLVNGTDISGAGAFVSTVNGWMDVPGIVADPAPVTGTIVINRAFPSP